MKTTFPPFLAVALAAALLAPSVRADDAAATAANDSPPRFEEEVVVTATTTEEPVAKVPASVTVVGHDEIEARKARFVTEVLASVPGVDLASVGGPGAVTSTFTRGTNSTQTLVLLDGVTLNTPYFSGYDIAHWTTDALDRVEVVKGPFSALWGADAVGGVVNLITRHGGDEPFDGSVAVEGGSDSYRWESASVNGSVGPLSYGLSLHDRAGDGRFDGWGGVARDSYESRGGTADLRFDLGGGTSLGLVASRRKSELAIPFENGFGTPARADRRQSDDETVLIAPLQGQVGESWSWNVTASRVEDEQRFRDPEDSFGLTRSDIRSTTTAGKTTHDLRFGDHLVTVGGEWRRREVDDHDAFGTNLAGQGDDVVGLFAEDQWRVGDRLVAQIGLRWDDDETWGSFTSPRIALAWFAADGRTRLHAAWGEAYRAPSVGELYYPYFGNRDLEPERSRSLELGVRHRRRVGLVELELFADLFRDDLRQLIEYDFDLFALGNLGRARTRGVEAGVRAELGSRWRIDASVTRLDAENRASGESLLRRPRWSADLLVEAHPLTPLSLSATATFVGARDDVDVDFSRRRNPSFTRVDLAASWDFAWVSPYLRVENLLDRDYQSVLGYPAPERTVVAGVRVGL